MGFSRLAAAAAVLAAAASLAGCGSGSDRAARATTGAVAAATTTKQAPAVTANPPRLQVGDAAAAYQRALVRVVDAVSPSVVQISTTRGLGSGVVFDDRGDIVTNAHVVGAAHSFAVTTADGKQLQASLVGVFAPDDLAVIKVSGGNLKAAAFADSSTLKRGDIAIAIGNPLGLQSSVTDGIVSAFRQNVAEGNGVVIPSMIQTSAAINPGNSGGALVDIEGKVIGIPTLAATDPQLGGSAAPGIGFAIPSNLVTDIAGQIVAHGHVVSSHRAYLGVQIGETNGNGVYVARVLAGTPAADAGIRAGEIIVSIAGTPTPTTAALAQVLAGERPGRTVDVVVETQSGAKRTVRVTLASYPG